MSSVCLSFSNCWDDFSIVKTFLFSFSTCMNILDIWYSFKTIVVGGIVNAMATSTLHNFPRNFTLSSLQMYFTVEMQHNCSYLSKQKFPWLSIVPCHTVDPSSITNRQITLSKQLQFVYTNPTLLKCSFMNLFFSHSFGFMQIVGFMLLRLVTWVCPVSLDKEFYMGYQPGH